MRAVGDRMWEMTRCLVVVKKGVMRGKPRFFVLLLFERVRHRHAEIRGRGISRYVPGEVDCCVHGNWQLIGEDG